MASYGEIWSLFVQYPNRDQVLREIAPPNDLSDLRLALEVFDDQQLLVADRRNRSQFLLVERLDQLHDGASLRVTVPRRRIYVSLEGSGRTRQVAWYPGATAERIESAIAKACGLPAKTPIELVDGDVAVVISATLPHEHSFTAVPLTNGHAANGAGRPLPTSPGGASSVNVPPRRNASDEHSTSRRSAGASYTPTVPSAAPRSESVRNPSPTAGAVASRSDSALPRSGSGTGSPGAGGGAAAASSRAASPTRESLTGLSTAGSITGGGGRDSTDLAAQPAGRVSAPDEHCVHILAGHAGFVLSLCTVGDVLFTGSQDCNIMIWDLNNLQYIGTLPGHRGFVKCMCATLPRKMLCSGSQDKTIKVWSLETFSSTKTLHGHSGEVNSLTILEGSDALVSGSEDRSIRIWDLSSLVQLALLEQAHTSSVFALGQLDGGLFLSASRDRTLKVWLAATWQARRTLSPPHYDGVSDIAVGASRQRFYSASRDRSIRRWDARTFESDLQLTHAHGDWLTSLALAPSEQVLFSGSKDCVVKVWDPDLRCKDLLLGHRGAISSLITIDGHLFSASHDRTVRVWRVGQYESSTEP